MIKKILALGLIFTQLAYAGLPPTSTKGLYDVKPITTFNYQFPGYPITHTGVTASIGIPAVTLPNYVGLNSSWANTQTSDPGAEATLGNWAAYKNTVAGVTPDAGMTGGTPSGNVLLTRTTTAGQVLDGNASFLITKSAVSVQGEGFSVIANVPPAFRTANATISIPFKVISGSIVQGDVKVFLYDVTNSQVITPFNNDVVGAQGVVTAVASLSSTTSQIRVGFHFASTAATALTLAFDDVNVGPAQFATGFAGSNTKNDLVFTPNNFGAVTSASYYYKRIGDTLQMRGFFITGSGSPAPGSLSLPTGYTIDASKLSGVSNSQGVGIWQILNTGAAANLFGSGAVGDLFYDGADTSKVYFTHQSASSAYTKPNVSTFAGSVGNPIDFNITVPIAGWDSNITIGQSSTFKISSVLATGTRVVGVAPANLGEYRSYLRNASNATFTETNAAPTSPPTVNDGVRIYEGFAWGTADSNNQPTKFDIFVGKNKNIKVNFYASTGHTGFIDASPQTSPPSTVDVGYIQNYDPTTGILTISSNLNYGTSRLFHRSGYDSDGFTFIHSPYFDITVSENALAVGLTTSGGGSSTWGSITGTLSSQTDLQSALGLKQDRLRATRTVTTTGTILSTDDFINVNAAGATTQTLPSAATSGQAIIIKNIGAGTPTISGTDLIDGAATLTLTTGSSISLISSGGTWNIW